MTPDWHAVPMKHPVTDRALFLSVEHDDGRRLRVRLTDMRDVWIDEGCDDWLAQVKVL